MTNMREEAERKKEGTEGEQRGEKLEKDQLLLVSDKQREEEKETERRRRQLEVQRIKEARKKHMEKEQQRMRERVKQMFSQTLTFTPTKRGQRRGAGDISKASLTDGVQQETRDQEQSKPRGQEKPLSVSCPVSPVDEPLTISVKPLRPSPEEQPGAPPPSVADPAQPSAERRVGNESATVPEEPLVKPQTSSGPEGQSTEAQAKAGKGDGPKYKSKRRRLIGWFNKKVKEGHQRPTEESLRMEEQNGHLLRHIRPGCWEHDEVVTVAEFEQKKRRRLLHLEQKRQMWEARWRKWEEKRTEGRKERKEGRDVCSRKNEESRGLPALQGKALHRCRKWEGQRPCGVGGKWEEPNPSSTGGRSQSPLVPERLRGVKVCWT